jgi:hypothetical protein
MGRAMPDSLRKLKKLMPPLPGRRHTEVDWPLLEEHLGIVYPQSFKDFVSIYLFFRVRASQAK